LPPLVVSIIVVIGVVGAPTAPEDAALAPGIVVIVVSGAPSAQNTLHQFTARVNASIVQVGAAPPGAFDMVPDATVTARKLSASG
jgi:hypothetical protein